MTSKTLANVSIAIKIYNSCFNKFKNILPWTEPIPDRISQAICILKECVFDFKINKDLENQLKYSFMIDEYYDELYKHTLDRMDKLNQSANFKEIISLCDKFNKQQIINNKKIKYDIDKLINKYILLSESTGDDYREEYCYKFVLNHYANAASTHINLLCDLYVKLKNLQGEYNEKYPELLIVYNGDFNQGALLYEEIVLAKINKNPFYMYTIDVILLKAFLCYLCMDEIKAKRKLNEFNENYSTFSKKYNFCVNIMNSYIEKDVDKFTDIVKDYDSISKLDNILTYLLLVLKRNMQQSEIDIC